MQQSRAFQEPLLKGHLPKDTKSLLQMNQRKGMLSSDMNSPLDNGKSGKSST